MESIDGLIRQLVEPPQRIAGRDPILDRDLGEQQARALMLTSHQEGRLPHFRKSRRVFSELLRGGAAEENSTAFDDRTLTCYEGHSRPWQQCQG
jgi:hypothetical protein